MLHHLVHAEISIATYQWNQCQCSSGYFLFISNICLPSFFTRYFPSIHPSFWLLNSIHLILGRAEAVALLLQAGANARQPAVTGVFLGKTPLMWASSQGRTEVVKLLILAGVDVDHSSHLGNFKVRTILNFNTISSSDFRGT